MGQEVVGMDKGIVRVMGEQAVPSVLQLAQGFGERVPAQFVGMSRARFHSQEEYWAILPKTYKHGGESSESQKGWSEAP